MRRSLLVVLVLGVISLVPFPAAPSAGSCAAPSLSLEGAESASDERPVVRLGEEITVLGRGFAAGCDDGDSYDGGGAVFGCSGNDTSTEQSLTDIELVLLQGQPTQTQTSLARADAGSAADGELGHVTWTFTVPVDARLGRATIKSVGSEPLPVRIVA